MASSTRIVSLLFLLAAVVLGLAEIHESDVFGTALGRIIPGPIPCLDIVCPQIACLPVARLSPLVPLLGTPQRYENFSGSIFKGKVVKATGLCGTVYVVRVSENFKGCPLAEKRVKVSVSPCSQAGGLSVGSSYLFYVTRVSAGSYSVGICDFMPLWSTIRQEKGAIRYLKRRSATMTCAGKCFDGSLPVFCKTNPCDVSKCLVKGATCVPSYCGGCNAEFYTSDGFLALRC